jgi:hypothetical protein
VSLSRHRARSPRRRCPSLAFPARHMLRGSGLQCPSAARFRLRLVQPFAARARAHRPSPVEREPNIEFRPRTRVTELSASPDDRGVAGVRFEDTRGTSESLAADLVVDASGRASLTRPFLERSAGRGRQRSRSRLIRPIQRPSSRRPMMLRQIGSAWCMRRHRPAAAAWQSFSR